MILCKMKLTLFQDQVKDRVRNFRSDTGKDRIDTDLFTLTQLQKLYEAVNGEEMDKRNFRKRIKEMTYIEKTELIDKTTSKRGAYLYRFNKRSFKDQERSFKL